MTITDAIPPIFEAHATFHVDAAPSSISAYERAVVTHLADRSGEQPWWLGYLDTGDPIDLLQHDPQVQARRVALGEAAAAPGRSYL